MSRGAKRAARQPNRTEFSGQKEIPNSVKRRKEKFLIIYMPKTPEQQPLSEISEPAVKQKEPEQILGELLKLDPERLPEEWEEMSEFEQRNVLKRWQAGLKWYLEDIKELANGVPMLKAAGYDVEVTVSPKSNSFFVGTPARNVPPTISVVVKRGEKKEWLKSSISFKDDLDKYPPEKLEEAVARDTRYIEGKVQGFVRAAALFKE